MSSGDDEPKQLGWSVERLLHTMKAPSTDVLKAVFLQWPKIVGEDMAAHAQPSVIDGRTLVVIADDPTWASQLQWLESELIAKIAEVSGSDRVQTIKVRVRPQGSRPPD
ncbi:MAG: DUF721 domain-containing protein [Acidimicrobiaceae bacterium]|nr:DUF721 domain-containing protein [Acidimicrobiaceae bacterium]MYC42111.1 DUF721 domain-containing protein [Acidimicrobiaceae bacterium]MYH87401.1 DUF721 domain-containing protein [Acidimicrobiaceae bacterium]